LDLAFFKGDFYKICGLDFGSICKFKLGVNKYFFWSLLNTIIAIYFNIYISEEGLAKFFKSVYIYYTTSLLKVLLFSHNKKALQQNAKGLKMSWLPRQDDFRNFCISDETEKVYHKLEELISNY
jgi:hypothetical protein